MKIIAITRPKEHLEESAELAKSYGYKVIAASMIELRERGDPEFDVFVQHVLGSEADYVIFTSTNGVRFTLKKAFKVLKKANCTKKFIDALNECKIIAIGPSTQRELEKHGIDVDGMPRTHSSSGIVSMLAPYVKEKKVEVVRSTQGSQLLVKGLRKNGAFVHEVQVYEIISPRDERSRQLIEVALKGEIDVYTFTSTMTVKNFLTIAEELGVRHNIIEKMNERTIAAIGEATATALKKNGVHVDVIPKRFTFKNMLDEIKKVGS
ncbi:MAG: uroporphyrinogen-III synthase [Methanocellales archaeon]|nr:uroporphyrinogen-III synthase [Methanocellales archaeon]MDD3291932.1 uroporphyrinogen-III synthase [Methanocellales archaeon]MDD5235667.1 uroporphyrinogen-III synthase [Methanocellales archaeon]MDD5485514.1 uroporphyrinogen-III synthase [Methanocellales archaeon]